MTALCENIEDNLIRIHIHLQRYVTSGDRKQISGNYLSITKLS